MGHSKDCDKEICGTGAIEGHTCPYQTEINNDFEYTCECCEACEQECANDI